MAPWLRRQDGAITILTAVIFVALLAAGAVAVDVGRLAVSSRDQQGASDRAALDGVLAISQAGDPFVTGPAAALASLERNLGVSAPGRLSGGRSSIIEIGSWDEGQGFRALAPGALLPNAVRVVTTADVRSRLIPGANTVVREAVARQETLASLSAASTTASLDAGLLNDLLSGLLGADVALDLASWQGLAGTALNLGDLAVALGAGTVDELLDTQVGFGELVLAAANALPAEGAAAQAALAGFPVTVPGLPPIRLGDVLDVEQGTGSALAADIGLLELLNAAAQAANRNNFVDLDLGVPGVADVRLQLIEPPVTAVGRAGRDVDGFFRTVARTAQTRLELTIPLAGTGIDLGGVVRALDGGLRIVVQTGRGEARVATARCGDPGQVGIDVIGAGASIGVDPVRILDVNVLGLIRARVGVDMPLTPIAPSAGEFDFDGPFPSDPRSVATSDLQLGEFIRNGLRLTSDTGVTVLGLPLALGTVLNSVLDAVTPALTVLDGPIDELLSSLGVSLGGVETRALDVDCSGRVLVDPRGVAVASGG